MTSIFFSVADIVLVGDENFYKIKLLKCDKSIEIKHNIIVIGQ
jgi:hypothetical protein